MDTRTTTITATPTDALIPLMWLASPALPVGGFSYSEGLEPAVDAGLVHDESSAAEWLSQQLRLTVARADLVVVGRVLGDPSQCEAMNDWVLRSRETSELRQQTAQMGRSLLEWAKSVGRPVPGGDAFTYPVAWALVASTFHAAPREALHAFAFGWAENMVQAAVRAVPLGQSSGQRILSRLAAEIPRAASDALARGEPQAFSPMLAILSSRHETQYSRLFRS